MRGRGPAWLIVALACVVAAPAGFAYDEYRWNDYDAAAAARRAEPHDKIDETMGRYNLHPAFQKLGRGASNFFGGFLEIPVNISERYSVSDTAGSWFTGLAYGLFKGAVRTAVGAYEVVSFPLPYPEDFAPILPTLEYFRKDKRRKPLPFE